MVLGVTCKVQFGVESVSDCGTGSTCNTLKYHIYMREVTCNEWISAQQEWTLDSCQVGSYNICILYLQSAVMGWLSFMYPCNIFQQCCWKTQPKMSNIVCSYETQAVS